MTAAPFDDIHKLIGDLPSPPQLSPADPRTGRLGEIAAFLAAWSGGRVIRPVVAIYAGSSGADPRAVRARLEAIAAGAASQARLALAAGAGLEAFDLAIDRPTPDMAAEATLDERACAGTMAFGMEVMAKQPDLLAPAALGDDGGAAAAAVAMSLYGGAAGDWTEHEAPQVTAAVSRLRQHADAAPDPLQVLRQLGGRPMAAVAGAILAARVQGTPVLLDGCTACSAAAVLHACDPRATEHCLAADGPGAAGHARVLQRLGLKPITHLGLEQEPGLGALAALGVIKAAAALNG